MADTKARKFAGGKLKKKHAGGRPTKFTPDVIDKLEKCFTMGCSDKEACLVAGISMAALYRFQERSPQFRERKDLLKETPVVKARQTVIQNLNDPEHAKWFLERKVKNEFASRLEVPLSGEVKFEMVRFSDLKE